MRFFSTNLFLILLIKSMKITRGVPGECTRVGFPVEWVVLPRQRRQKLCSFRGASSLQSGGCCHNSCNANHTSENLTQTLKPTKAHTHNTTHTFTNLNLSVQTHTKSIIKHTHIREISALNEIKNNANIIERSYHSQLKAWNS